MSEMKIFISICLITLLLKKCYFCAKSRTNVAEGNDEQFHDWYKD